MNLSIHRIYIILIAVSGVFLLTGCPEDTEDEDNKAQEQRFFDLYVESRYPDVDPQSNGLYFIEHKEGTGSFPDTTDWLLINYVATKIPQEIIFESYLENVAIDNGFYKSEVLYGPFKVQNSTRVKGLTEGLLLMKEGTQAIMFFTSDLGYGPNGFGKVTGYQSLKYEVELLEVIEDIESFEQARIEAFVDTIPEVDTIHDPTTDAVMYYVIDEATDGDSIKNDSIVQIAYKGYLIDGRVFDESATDEYYEFPVGDYEDERSPIVGWHLGLLKFREGEKGRLIIPYHLGYSEAGRQTTDGLTVIPPYETLIFDIEVVAVKGPANPDPNPEE
ncbi:MAG: FKBP-type peptidyl-prolyl cis-trans isomerase [Bacteroidales bacterium]|nr:FKBP-type peptidyl-prolyl cis-trans isomerase [Bacteroidales bacterium]